MLSVYYPLFAEHHYPALYIPRAQENKGYSAHLPFPWQLLSEITFLPLWYNPLHYFMPFRLKKVPQENQAALRNQTPYV